MLGECEYDGKKAPYGSRNGGQRVVVIAYYIRMTRALSLYLLLSIGFQVVRCIFHTTFFVAAPQCRYLQLCVSLIPAIPVVHVLRHIGTQNTA